MEKCTYTKHQFFFCNLGFELACFEHSVLELWAVNGGYSDTSERKISQLTQEKILHSINANNYRFVFRLNTTSSHTKKYFQILIFSISIHIFQWAFPHRKGFQDPIRRS